VSDIPEDIMEMAWRAPCEMGGWRGHIHMGVAHAILTERNRCAKIAAQYIAKGNRLHPDVPADQMDENTRVIANWTCQNIAAAIRGED